MDNLEKLIKVVLSPDVSFEMILVEGGTFPMGSELYPMTMPIREVTISDFYIATTPVTQKVWNFIVNSISPSDNQGPDFPVERVSWYDCKAFIADLENKTQLPFRLPSEAEWEYAARGGKFTQNYQYAGSDKLIQVGWYEENSNGSMHEVAQLLPNELGICDMSGNVWEWCEDDWHDNYEYAPIDETPWVTNFNRGALFMPDGRVVRGGSFFLDSSFCQIITRTGVEAGRASEAGGFRLAMSPNAPTFITIFL